MSDSMAAILSGSSVQVEGVNRPGRRVHVRTGSRLHFGLLSVGQSTGRQFGGIGLMLRSPGWELSLTRGMPAHPGQTVSVRPHASEGSDDAARVRRALLALRQQMNLDPTETADSMTAEPVCGWLCEFRSVIPGHVGLGSGTQLGLAVAAAAQLLEIGTCPPAPELALAARRGLRSAVGLWGFEQGGFLVEAGQSRPGAVSPLVSRLEFPEHWPVLLVRPQGVTGVSGDLERAEFSRLTPMPRELTDQLAGLVLTQILPAITEQDYQEFGKALSHYGQLVGSYFARSQGGIFADRRLEQVASLAARHGATAAAQSSWGPTLAVICPDQATVDRIREELLQDPQRPGWSVEQTAALNQPAEIRIES